MAKSIRQLPGSKSIEYVIMFEFFLFIIFKIAFTFDRFRTR